MKFFKDLISFIQNVAQDSAIPSSDKKILLVLIGLIISPIDIIPDWIPIIGLMDDMVILAIVLDYFFNHLDQNLLLSHYPWGMKSFVRVRRTAQIITVLTPKWFKNRIWKYQPSPYQK